jgi:hypothetical protein
MIQAEAEPLPDGTPGHARILVRGSPMPVGRLVFQLRREGYSQGFLGRAGWQATEEMLTPLEVLPEGDGFAIVVGPEVSRHLTEAPYLFRMPELNVELPIFWPFIEDEVPGIEYVRQGPSAPPSSPLAAQPTVAQPAPQPAAAQPPQAPPVLTATPKPEPLTGDDPQSVPVWRKPWPWAALVALALLSGGLYASRDSLFGERPAHFDDARPTPAMPPAQSDPAPAQPAPPPGRQQAGPAWPEGTDGFTPREVVAQAPNAAAIFRVAQRRAEQGRHDDALDLLESAAERGDGEASLQLARLHDPIGFVAGRPFQQPNTHEAARHYRDAVQRGVAVGEQTRGALRAFLEQRAAAGDGEARSILVEFWP